MNTHTFRSHRVYMRAAGMPMELVLRELYEDDEHVYLTWNWKPANGGEA